ncbi:MAG: hypothetical protein N7Q72_07580 [Spiroplasma sp. Tabriz.8]|nr:hypothetical protein [Spiroplasma sp. Tabriz.8]
MHFRNETISVFRHLLYLFIYLFIYFLVKEKQTNNSFILFFIKR